MKTLSRIIVGACRSVRPYLLNEGKLSMIIPLASQHLSLNLLDKIPWNIHQRMFHSYIILDVGDHVVQSVLIPPRQGGATSKSANPPVSQEKLWLKDSELHVCTW